jgi:hypothetical protein
MANSFATVDDLAALWRPLTAEETTRAEALLPVISDALREHARRAGKDLDEMAAASAAYANVVKLVTVNVLSRTLLTSTSGDLISQASQTAGPYTVSSTYANPTRDVLIYQNDLKELGLKRQRYGVVDFYGDD